jgi:uncharacterized protein YbaR (Trm112 family)
MLDSMLLEILACPKCKGPLEYHPEAGTLTSWQSMLRYRIEDDIPIMLIEEAQQLTADDLAQHLLARLPTDVECQALRDAADAASLRQLLEQYQETLGLAATEWLARSDEELSELAESLRATP